jgi:hypothetical protein
MADQVYAERQEGQFNQDEIQTLHLHPETRNTILFKSLEEFWENHKILYVLCTFMLIAIIITSIIFVLTTIVVPSERYNFL